MEENGHSELNSYWAILGKAQRYGWDRLSRSEKKRAKELMRAWRRWFLSLDERKLARDVELKLERAMKCSVTSVALSTPKRQIAKRILE